MSREERRAIYAGRDGAGSGACYHTLALKQALLDQEYRDPAYPCLRGAKDSRISLAAEGLFCGQGSGKDWRAQKPRTPLEISGKRRSGVRDEVITGGGENQGVYSAGWRNRPCYVEMKITTADQPLRINDFFGWYEGYPFRYTARF